MPPRRPCTPPPPTADTPPSHDPDTPSSSSAGDGASEASLASGDSGRGRLATLEARVAAARAEHAALVTRAALLDARERHVAAAEARLAAARAQRAGADALDPLLGAAIDALRGGDDRAARSTAVLVAAALADRVVADAFGAGGGALPPAAAGALAVPISVGPAAGTRVSLADMLTWSSDTFLDTIAAAKAEICSAVDTRAAPAAIDDAGPAAAALNDLFVAVATYRHASMPAVARAQLLARGDDRGATPPPLSDVSAATLVDRMAVFSHPGQAGALLDARADYVRRVAAARAQRERLLTTLRGTLLTGAAPAAPGDAGADAAAPPLPRTAYADAVRAAAELRDGVNEEAAARVDLAVTVSARTLTVRQRLLYFALVPGPTMVPDLVEEVARRAGLPPAAAVLAGAAPPPDER